MTSSPRFAGSAIWTLRPRSRPRCETRLGDRSNLVVAAAATIAGDQRLTELAGPLEVAFRRFMEDPEKTDKLCRAKLAVIQALDKMEHGNGRGIPSGRAARPARARLGRQ